MADFRISDLPAAGVALGTQQHEVNDGGVSRSITNAQIVEYAKGEITASDVGALSTANNLSDLSDAAQAKQNLDIQGQEVAYDTTTSGLTATDVQGAIDEVDSESVKLTGDQSISGVKTFTNATNVLTVTETIRGNSGTAIQATLGSIWTRTLTGNITFTDSLSAGQWQSLHLVNGSSHTVTWPAGTKWLGGSPPSLAADDLIVFWKVGTSLYANYVGSFA